jgi:hypothetical protein
MSPRFLAPMCLLAVILLAAMPAAGQSWTPPRTPWGDPDLQGWFSNLNEDGTPLERPEQFAGRCITRGLPGSMMPAIYGNSYQIGKKLFAGSSGTGAPDERPEK